jgi:hypothetical protein
VTSYSYVCFLSVLHSGTDEPDLVRAHQMLTVELYRADAC